MGSSPNAERDGYILPCGSSSRSAEAHVNRDRRGITQNLKKPEILTLFSVNSTKPLSGLLQRRKMMLTGWRSCPFTQERDESKRQVCNVCPRKCRQLYALGLDDSGAPLPLGKRPRCKAKAKGGERCKSPVIAGKSRCGAHGGYSTGPKTPAGRSRIGDAQRRRWQDYRCKQGAGDEGSR